MSSEEDAFSDPEGDKMRAYWVNREYKKLEDLAKLELAEEEARTLKEAKLSEINDSETDSDSTASDATTESQIWARAEELKQREEELARIAFIQGIAGSCAQASWEMISQKAVASIGSAIFEERKRQRDIRIEMARRKMSEQFYACLKDTEYHSWNVVAKKEAMRARRRSKQRRRSLRLRKVQPASAEFVRRFGNPTTVETFPSENVNAEFVPERTRHTVAAPLIETLARRGNEDLRFLAQSIYFRPLLESSLTSKVVLGDTILASKDYFETAEIQALILGAHVVKWGTSASDMNTDELKKSLATLFDALRDPGSEVLTSWKLSEHMTSSLRAIQLSATSTLAFPLMYPELYKHSIESILGKRGKLEFDFPKFCALVVALNPCFDAVGCCDSCNGVFEVPGASMVYAFLRSSREGNTIWKALQAKGKAPTYPPPCKGYTCSGCGNHIDILTSRIRTVLTHACALGALSFESPGALQSTLIQNLPAPHVSIVQWYGEAGMEHVVGEKKFEQELVKITDHSNKLVKRNAATSKSFFNPETDNRFDLLVDFGGIQLGGFRRCRAYRASILGKSILLEAECALTLTSYNYILDETSSEFLKTWVSTRQTQSGMLRTAFECLELRNRPTDRRKKYLYMDFGQVWHLRNKSKEEREKSASKPVKLRKAGKPRPVQRESNKPPAMKEEINEAEDNDGTGDDAIMIFEERTKTISGMVYNVHAKAYADDGDIVLILEDECFDKCTYRVDDDLKSSIKETFGAKSAREVAVWATECLELVKDPTDRRKHHIHCNIVAGSLRASPKRVQTPKKKGKTERAKEAREIKRREAAQRKAAEKAAAEQERLSKDERVRAEILNQENVDVSGLAHNITGYLLNNGNVKLVAVETEDLGSKKKTLLLDSQIITKMVDVYKSYDHPEMQEALIANLKLSPQPEDRRKTQLELGVPIETLIPLPKPIPKRKMSRRPSQLPAINTVLSSENAKQEILVEAVDPEEFDGAGVGDVLFQCCMEISGELHAVQGVANDDGSLELQAQDASYNVRKVTLTDEVILHMEKYVDKDKALVLNQASLCLDLKRDPKDRRKKHLIVNLEIAKSWKLKRINRRRKSSMIVASNINVN